MKKELVIGKNYIDIFGVTDPKKKLIYKGENNWLAVNGDKEMTKNDPATSKKVLDYINQASYRIGP